MLKNIKDSFEGGIEKIKWYSRLLNERLRIELAVMKLLIKSEDIKKKREKLACSIGERIFELRAAETNILKDGTVKEAIKEMETLDAELEVLRVKMTDIGKAEI